jgi:tryptophan synthase beta chain
VIGDEARTQILEREGRDPDIAVACVGGGSNAIGLFTAFLERPVRLVGVEGGGRGGDLGEHSATLSNGSPGVLHGARTFLLQDGGGQVAPTHSVSAGLDYPGVGPEHAHLLTAGRAEYVTATDREAVAGFLALSELEGIVPALEPAHALGWLLRRPVPARSMVLLCLSGRGDKDLATVGAWLGEHGRPATAP